MESIAQYLNPAFWWTSVQASVSGLDRTASWIAILQIVAINVLLWGDNAVVIALACRGLPPRQRFWGIAIGAGVSALLLIVFTSVVAQLLALPYLKLIGGLALLYIAAKLLAPADAETNEAEAPAHLWRVVRVVVLIDIIMSLDNVIAIAAAARGNLALLVIGLAISIPILLAGAALTIALFERFPILVWAGAALLGWIAGEVIATDPVVSGYLSATFGESAARQVETAAAVAGTLLVIAIGGLWRRSHVSRNLAGASDERARDP